MAADADCSKVHIVSAVHQEDEKGHRTFNLQLDLAELEKEITGLGDALLVIIDPITSYLGKVDSHKNAELRSVLEPLGEMAARLHVTVIANTHCKQGHRRERQQPRHRLRRLRQSCPSGFHRHGRRGGQGRSGCSFRQRQTSAAA